LGFFTKSVFDTPDWITNPTHTVSPDQIKYYADLNEKKKSIINLMTQEIQEGGVDFRRRNIVTSKYRLETAEYDGL
jgi:hypothetical protein